MGWYKKTTTSSGLFSFSLPLSLFIFSYSPTSLSSFQWIYRMIGHFHDSCRIALPQTNNGTHRTKTADAIPAMAPKALSYPAFSTQVLV